MTSSPFTVKEHVVPTQYIREYPGATLEDQEETLSLHVKQYTPKGRQGIKPGAVTIIGAHANGFPKELYEPLWQGLCLFLEAKGLEIQSIWIADVSHQGVSGILNEDKLGNDPHWNDHARDLLYMINYFRREMPRPLVGVGHSLGGCNLVNLSLMHPRLLSALVLIEPVVTGQALHPDQVQTDESNGDDFLISWPRSSALRRDWWPSRAAAASAFKQSKFYKPWDPRVLDLWIQYGLRDVPSAVRPQHSPSSSPDNETPVTLATTKHHEVFTFVRPSWNTKFDPVTKALKYDRAETPDLHPNSTMLWPFYWSAAPMTFDNLKHLRPPVLYIFGGKSVLWWAEVQKEAFRRTGTGVGGSGGAAEGKVKAHTISSASHLVPMEQVGQVTDIAGEWLVDELQKWRKREDDWNRQWMQKSKEERSMLTPEFQSMLQGNAKVSERRKAKI